MHRFISCFISIAIASAPVTAGAQQAGSQTADWIIEARYVLTMDGTHRIIENGAVVINGERIVAVGTQSDLERQFTSAHVLKRPQSVVMPGLIDTHTHASMSLFRGFADDRRLNDWLTNFIFPAESKNVDREFVHWGTSLACLEMALDGTTTYTDMYYFEDEVAATTKAAGLRGVLGQSVIGFAAPDFKTWQEAVRAAGRFIDTYGHDSLIVPAVAPHAIYTTPDEALVAAHNLAVQMNAPLLIHLSETIKEREDTLAQRQMSPTQVLDRLGVLDGRVVAAHSISMSDDDLALLKKHGAGVAHCPSSNMKMAAGVAPVVKMLKMGINVGLGTDGFAGSNDSADLILEMNLAAKLQKITTMDPQSLPAEQVVEMATMGGARVLGLEKEIGSLERGKRADLISISLSRPNAIPFYNLYSQIAYATKAPDVEDVFVNGKQIVEARRMLTVNSEEIFLQAERYKLKINKSLQSP